MNPLRQYILLFVLGMAVSSCKKEPLSDECQNFIGRWKWTEYTVYSEMSPFSGDTLPAFSEFEIEFLSNGRVCIRRGRLFNQSSVMNDVSIFEDSVLQRKIMYARSSLFRKYNVPTGNDSKQFTLEEESDLLVVQALGLIEIPGDAEASHRYFFRKD